MPSRTSFFSAKIYKNTLSRFWYLGAVYAAVCTFHLLQTFSSGWGWRGPDVYYSAQAGTAVLQAVRAGLRSPVPAAACAVVAAAVYGWLFQTRAAAFTSALPLRREAVFTANMAAGLTLLLGGNLLAFALTGVLGLGAGNLLPALGVWLAVVTPLTVAFFGLATFCAVLTGNVVILPALYLVLLYGAVALEASLRRIAQFLVFGLSNQSWKLTALSPLYYLSQLSGALSAYVSWDGAVDWKGVGTALRGPLLGYALAGLVLGAAAALILRRRKMESAGDVVAAPGLRKWFRWAAAFAGALTAGFVALQTVFGYRGYEQPGGNPPQVALLLSLMILGALAGWFGSQAMMKRTLRVFDRDWGGFGVVCAALFALVYGLDFNVLGLENRLPSPEQVASADILCPTLRVDSTFREGENIREVLRFQGDIIANKKNFERNAYSGGTSGGALTVRYYDEDGELLLWRTYAAPPGEYAWASKGNAEVSGDWGTKNPVLGELQDLVNRPEAVEQRMIPSFPLSAGGENVEFAAVYFNSGEEHKTVNLTAQEAMEVYLQCILPDMEDSSLGRVRLTPEEGPSEQGAGISISFRHMDQGEGKYQWHSLDLYRIPADAGRTNAWLVNHGVPVESASPAGGENHSWTAVDVPALEGVGLELENLYLGYDPDSAGPLVNLRWARNLLEAYAAEGADPFLAYEQAKEFAQRYEVRANRFPDTLKLLREAGERLAAGDLGLVREPGGTAFTPEQAEDLFDALRAALKLEE